MKKKRISTIILVGVLVATSVLGFATPIQYLTQTVYAAETANLGDKVTAKLNSAKFSFGNQPVKTLQTYLINNDTNYIRIRDFLMGVDLLPVTYAEEPNYVYIFDAPYDDNVVMTDTPPVNNGETTKPRKMTVMPMLSTDNVKVTLKETTIMWCGTPYTVTAFNLDNTNYFKVADLQKASDNALTVTTADMVAYGKKNAKDGIVTQHPSIQTISVQWDSATNVIHVDKTRQDMQKVYEDARLGNTPVTTPTQATAPTPTTTSDNATAKKQPVLTSAPTVGTTLAKILVDESKPVYKDSATQIVDWDNITDAYKSFSVRGMFGQCTWYALERFQETTGVDISVNSFWGSDYSEMVQNANKFPDVKGVSDLNGIQPQSIAVFKNHLVFVEYVERDSNGKPIDVYYTDANWGNDGSFVYGRDATVRKLSFDNFKTANKGLIGYIAAK